MSSLKRLDDELENDIQMDTNGIEGSTKTIESKQIAESSTLACKQAKEKGKQVVEEDETVKNEYETTNSEKKTANDENKVVKTEDTTAENEDETTKNEDEKTNKEAEEPRKRDSSLRRSSSVPTMPFHSEDETQLFEPVSFINDMQILEYENTDPRLKIEENKRPCMPKRYLIALLSFFGFFNVYCLRVDLSIALVAMTNNHTRVSLEGKQWMATPEFNWDQKLQGHILGSFFYGYLITQIPGGYIAARFGGKNLFGFSILMTSLLTMLTPVASRQHVAFLILLRFLEGVCEGCIYPSMYAIWSRWAPPLERSKLTTIPHAGSYAGSVAGTLLSGFLCELAGWSTVFYIFGSFGILWSVVWFVIAVDAPSLDPDISYRERKYIEDSLKNDHVSEKVSNPPWLKFMTSMPVIAILVAHTCEGWGFSTMQTCLPKYLTEALHLRISRAGIYAALLYFVMGVFVMSGGQVADIVREWGWLSTTNVRKLFTCIGFMAQAIAFVVAVHLKNIHAGVAVLVLGGGVEGLAWAGFAVNHLDIAPRYSSILFGITNTSSTIPGILSPLLVGYITLHKSMEEWRIVFYIGSATFAIGSLFYGLFASAEKQPWADGDTSYENLTNEEK